jgi:primosomal protein N' (replication factor Y)
LPFKELGTIVVDEEHDASYKQDEGISYNARDMAIARASLENIPINLVTSIPSVETYNNVINKKYSITKLTKRYKSAKLPKVEIINLQNENLKKGFWIAEKTLSEVNKYLSKGDQVLFFLNRRGYSPFVICKKCGVNLQCPNCSINLNYHKKLNKLLCHHCGYKSVLERKCKDKKDCDFIFCGPGIERIYLELKKIYPNKKIEMFSSDTLKKNSVSNLLIKKAEEKEIDILVGTQLLSKGFHFPKLNCIIVVDSDFSSHGYDLRSAEKNVQLYHQLSGRAGRAGSESAIYFQTYTPEDEILLNIAKNNPSAFLQKELLLRKEKKLPPFYRLISLIISGDNEILIMKFAVAIKLKLPKINNVNVLGPVMAPIIKIKKKYRCRILIRYPKNLFIQKYLAQFLNKIKMQSGIKLEVDVDPVNFS